MCFTNPDIFSLVKFKLVRKKTRQVSSMLPGSRVSYRQVSCNRDRVSYRQVCSFRDRVSYRQVSWNRDRVSYRQVSCYRDRVSYRQIRS